MDKPPCVEPRKPMNWCARQVYESAVQGRMILPREWWPGWRIMQDRIVGPGGISFNRRKLEALWRLERMRDRRPMRETAAHTLNRR